MARSCSWPSLLYLSDRKSRYHCHDRVMVDASMWRHLVQPKPRDEFELLAQKLKQQEEAPLPLVDLALTNFQVKCGAHIIDALLDNYDDWQAVPHTHPDRSGHLALLQKEVDIELQAMRRRVHLMKTTHFRRVLAATRIQRTILRLLYTPRKKGVPLISRCLVRDGILKPTGSAEVGTIGSGDSDNDAARSQFHSGPVCKRSSLATVRLRGRHHGLVINGARLRTSRASDSTRLPPLPRASCVWLQPPPPRPSPTSSAPRRSRSPSRRALPLPP